MALVTMAAGSGALAAPTVLDFEDLAAGTVVTTQYGPRGVLFPGHYLDSEPAARSGTRVLRSANPGAEIFNPIPLIMTFTSAQARVKLFAKNTGIAQMGTLIAFDASDNIVGQDGPKLVAADVFSAGFEVVDPDATPSIVRAELRIESSAHFAIDDLEFDGEPPAPPPATPPVVQITSPPDGGELDIETMDIAGTVTGEGLVSPVRVTVEYRLPPESTAPPFQSDLALTGSGTTRQFALAGFTGVPMGPITITVTAQNFAAQQGTDSITFTNLPAAIRNRFTAEGGAATFGEFAFGLVAEGCKIAIYQQGAISATSAGVTRLVRGGILTKWLALRDAFNNDSLGCPSDEERAAEGGARAQDFQRGRIYANLPGTASSDTAYVPAVFVTALDKRGGELANGLPLSDPTDSSGPASQTWLFQRFLRPETTDPLASTLEIRGTPPVLWMERQLGAWFDGALDPSEADRALNRSAATLWEDFPCDGNLGPCTVQDELPPPPANPNVGDVFCNGVTYVPLLEGDCYDGGAVCDDRPCCIPAEWVPVRGDYDVTAVFGTIISAHMTDIDNGFTHETHNGNCPFFPNILEILSTVTCVSDFEFFVRPIGPQGDTSPLPSVFGKKNTDRIKTEYEVYYAAAAHNFLGAPREGDVVHTTGRWIVDCGHDTYKTELHPIFSYATMKTVVSETNLFTGLEEDLFGGKPATRVAIWINGWYPGGEDNAIEFDAYPPPRPSPDAVLHVAKPVDFGPGGYRAAEDVSLEFALEPPGAASHVHLKFTAPRRENAVTSAGEMKFEAGRQYWGKWYLYWGE